MSFFAKLYVNDGVVVSAQTSTTYLDKIIVQGKYDSIVSVEINAEYMHAGELLPLVKINGRDVVIDGIDGVYVFP